MDTLMLCWGFDTRWLFGLNFKTLFFVIIALFDILTIIGIQVQAKYKSINQCSPSSYTANTVILTLLAFGQLLIMTIVSILTYRQSPKWKVNKQKIKDFYESTKRKQYIWSIIGLIIFGLSVALGVVQLYQIRQNNSITKVCENSGVNLFRYIVQICSWVYIVGMLLLFIIRKVYNIVKAWKYPKQFLISHNYLSKQIL